MWSIWPLRAEEMGYDGWTGIMPRWSRLLGLVFRIAAQVFSASHLEIGRGSSGGSGLPNGVLVPSGDPCDCSSKLLARQTL